MYQHFDSNSRCYQLKRMIREYENPWSLSRATLERAGNVFLKSSLYGNESSKSREFKDPIVQESGKLRNEELKQEILSFVFYCYDCGTTIVSCMAKFLVEHCSLEEVVSVVTKDYWPQEANIGIMSEACISDRHDVFDYLVSIGTVPERFQLNISKGSVRDTLLQTMSSKDLLMDCCTTGDIPTAIKLIMNGTKINSKKRDYLTIAIANDQSEMVELLVSMGTRVNEDHLAKGQGFPQIAAILDK